MPGRAKPQVGWKLYQQREDMLLGTPCPPQSFPGSSHQKMMPLGIGGFFALLSPVWWHLTAWSLLRNRSGQLCLLVFNL
jgi:hypothetical protein